VLTGVAQISSYGVRTNYRLCALCTSRAKPHPWDRSVISWGLAAARNVRSSAPALPLPRRQQPFRPLMDLRSPAPDEGTKWFASKGGEKNDSIGERLTPVGGWNSGCLGRPEVWLRFREWGTFYM
jgi:hypothetical protein